MEAPDIECVDEWHPGTCSEAAMLAYKGLIAEGRIAIQRVEVGRHTGRMVIKYLADIPHPWMLELLGDRKREIEEANRA